MTQAKQERSVNYPDNNSGYMARKTWTNTQLPLRA